MNRPSSTNARPRITTPCLLSIAACVAVCSVATFTSLTTYAIGFQAVNEAGVESVKADLIGALLQIERYLSPLPKEARFVVAYATSNGLMAPNVSANPWAQLNTATKSINTVFRARASAFGILAVAFEDGAWVVSYQALKDLPAYQYQILPASNGARCGGTVRKRYFNLTSNADLSANSALVKASASQSAELGCRYDVPQSAIFFSQNLTAFSEPIVIPNTSHVMLPFVFSIPLVLAASSGAPQYAVGALSVSIDAIVNYLQQSVSAGIGGAAMLVDEKNRVVVSTLTDRPFTWTPPPKLVAQRCLDTPNFYSTTGVKQTCLFSVLEYGYSFAIAAHSAGFYDPASYPHYGNESAARTRDVKTRTFSEASGLTSESVVVAGARLRASLLGYYVTIFVSEASLHGDLDVPRQHMTAISTAMVALSIITICLSNAFIFRRLRRSADRVRSAALFHGCANADASLSASTSDDGGGADYGWITEVRNLEAAQQNLTVFYRALSGYMPKDVLRTLTVGGVPDVETQVKCAVLSADFTGFSSAACCGLAGPTVTLLSTLLYKATVDVLQQTAGTMLHFSGDGFVAAWGAGRKAPNMEARAALAGVLLQRAMKLDSVMDPFVDANEMPFVHIGLHCGVASVGVLGTPERLTLHVVGDLTLQAARLKARAALYDTRPLASEPFAKRLGKLFVMRQMVFPVEVDTDVQTAVTRRERTSTMMNSMRVVKSFELVGLASTESPDDLSRLRVNDNRINAEQQQQQQEATRPQANALGSAAGGAKLKARGRSVSPTAAAATARDKSSSAIIQRSDDDSLLGDVASGAFMRGSIDAREAPGSYNTLQLFDSVRGLPECTLEPGEFDLSLVKAYNQVSRAFLKGRFSTVVRRANRILSKLQADDPYVATLQVLVAMAQRAEHRTRR